MASRGVVGGGGVFAWNLTTVLAFICFTQFFRLKMQAVRKRQCRWTKR